MASSGDKQDSRSALHSAVMRLLRPLVRILLDHGVPFATFAEVARWVYVEVAENHFALPGRKQTDSRISVITGLTRKDVARIKKVDKPADEASALSYNRAARVVSAWVRDYPMEGTASGVALLPVEGSRRSLSALIHKYSGDMPVRAVIDELLRVGAIRIHDSGEAELLHRHYMPPPGERRKLVYLGDDVGDLISTIGHNLTAKPSEALFQRKVFYDNIPAEPAIAALVNDMGPHARDANEKVQGEGRFRAVVGIYSHEEMLTPESEPDDSAANGAAGQDKRIGRRARKAAGPRP